MSIGLSTDNIKSIENLIEENFKLNDTLSEKFEDFYLKLDHLQDEAPTARAAAAAQQKVVSEMTELSTRVRSCAPKQDLSKLKNAMIKFSKLKDANNERTEKRLNNINGKVNSVLNGDDKTSILEEKFLVFEKSLSQEMSIFRKNELEMKGMIDSMFEFFETFKVNRRVF